MNALAIIALLLVVVAALSFVITNKSNLSMKMIYSPGFLLGVAVLLLSINVVSENYDPAVDYRAQGWPTARNKVPAGSTCDYYQSSSYLPSCINTQSPSKCPGSC